MKTKVLAVLTAFFLSTTLALPVEITAYTSAVLQTDSTPHITATGTRTRIGIVAISRDLLRRYGYHSIVKILWTDCKNLPEMRFVVEDTMNARWNAKIDIWVPTESQARLIGRCKANVNFT